MGKREGIRGGGIRKKGKREKGERSQAWWHLLVNPSTGEAE